MKHPIRTKHKKESAPLLQGLLNSHTDIVANLASHARTMGVDIRLHGDKSIVISRWQFSREFNNPTAALQFLEDMGVTP